MAVPGFTRVSRPATNALNPIPPAPTLTLLLRATNPFDTLAESLKWPDQLDGGISLMNASERIDKRIGELDDWRGKLFAKVRTLIHEADPDIIEEWKWDTGIWSHNGLVCAVGAFKDHLKINFFKGASLEDPNGLFNAGLEAKATRAIDLYQRDSLDESALKGLICAAVAYNTKKKK